jgi:hypothetical protein
MAKFANKPPKRNALKINCFKNIVAYKQIKHVAKVLGKQD